MIRNKIQNKGKTLLAGLAMFVNATPASAQERFEIQVTQTNGVSRTIEVVRDIEELDFARSDLTSITLPNGLTNLEGLILSGNQLTNFTLPEGLTNLRELYISDNQLTNLILPNGLTNLGTLNLNENQLTSLTLPEGLTNLGGLSLSGNQLTSFTFLEGLTNLGGLDLQNNQLQSLTLPEGLTNLNYLNLSTNQLMSLTLPKGLTKLSSLYLRNNLLTNLVLSQDTASRSWRGRLKLYISDNSLMSIRQPVGMSISFDVGPEHYGISYYDILISRVENALEIFWAVGGVLQTSASIEGPWKDVIASSPLRVTPSLPAEFFRVRAE